MSQEGFRVIEKIPADEWVLSVSPTDGLDLCCLFRLGASPIDPAPPAKWKAAMSAVGVQGQVPWASVMPQSQYRSFIKNLIKSVISKFDELPKEYYKNTWIQCGSVLQSLRPAKIDTLLHKELIESEGISNGALETFKPGPGGYSQPVVYDRFGTRTGRLTVESGPNILTLKKEHRKILKSYYANGRIVSIDFSALEARIILLEAGRMPASDDIYRQISTELFKGAVQRSVVKVAVLSELYGVSRASLAHRLQMNDADLDRFIATIKGYFKTDALKLRLKDELEKCGMIRNKFGRPLFIDAKNSDYLLVNTYTQSTGVDVSLLGFSNVMERLGTDGVRPLFVLHDALILDVREDRMKDVESVSSVSVPTYDHEFPLKLEIM